jgi:nucleoside-triphosphatase
MRTDGIRAPYGRVDESDSRARLVLARRGTLADRPSTKRILLLTGAPSVGKTTIIRRVAEGLRDRKIRGFITDEIREDGRRVGFRLDTFCGQSTILAYVDTKSPHRVGRYGVDVEALDRIVDSALRPADDVDVYLIDEIGKMECSSPRFVAAMTLLLDSGPIVIGTISRKGAGFIEQVKQRRDAELWEITHANRDQAPDSVLDWFRTRARPTPRPRP